MKIHRAQCRRRAQMKCKEEKKRCQIFFIHNRQQRHFIHSGKHVIYLGESSKGLYRGGDFSFA